MIGDIVGGVLGKSQPTPPTPPDFAAAATAQGGANLDAAIAQGILNRPNQSSPFGTQTWTQTGSTDVGGRAVPNFSSSVNFTPTGQALFDKGLNLQTGEMDLGQNSLDNAKQALSGPFDITKNRDAIVDAMYHRSTRLLDPYYQQQEDNQKSNLINSGFSVGDEGYTRAMGNFQRGKDEAYQGAQDTAMTSGANQAIQEALLQRQEPLQELNAIRTGAMPTSPTFNNQTQAGSVAAAPIMAGTQAQSQAAQALYGQQSSNFNNAMTGLFDLGSAYMGRPA